MYTKKIFTVFGQDKRQTVIAKALSKKGHKVRLCCAGDLSELIDGCEMFLDWKQAVSGCDVIILPLPVSRDGVYVNGMDNVAVLVDVIEYSKKAGCECILGGLIPEKILNDENGSTKIIDYYKSEDLQKKNALPSAEGAMMIAMEHTEITVSHMKVLICGYGRIGSCLADILLKLGADVTVAARRDESLCDAAVKGCSTIRIISGITPCDVSNKRFDVIFNTVPYQIFTKSAIKTIQGKPLYIEIASQPYGIDLLAAREAGIEVIFAPSIPSKYAPITAGTYILETISEILEKRGINL